MNMYYPVGSCGPNKLPRETRTVNVSDAIFCKELSMARGQRNTTNPKKNLQTSGRMESEIMSESIVNVCSEVFMFCLP